MPLPASHFLRRLRRSLPWWLGGAAFLALAAVSSVAWQAANLQRRDGEGALRQAGSDAAARVLASLDEDRLQTTLPRLKMEWFTVHGDPEDWVFGPWPQPESEESRAFREMLALHHAGKTEEARKAFTAEAGKDYRQFTASGLPLGPLILRHLMETAPGKTERRRVAEVLLKAAVETPSILTTSLVEEGAGILAENPSSEERQSITAARSASARIELLRSDLRAHPSEVISGKPWIGEKWNLAYLNHGDIVVRSIDELSDWALQHGIGGAPVPGLPKGWIFHASRNGVNVQGLVEGAGSIMASQESGPWRVDAVCFYPEAFLTLDAQLSRQRWLIGGTAAFMSAALGGILYVLARQRRLNAMMSNFVASVSHELRAPVASMGLLAERLGDGRISGAEEQSRYHKLLCGESRRISATIENVLAFSRRERGRRVYDHELSDLTALLRDTVDIIKPLAEERQVLISASLPEKNVERELDPIAIRQAVLNLLDNALKFSPPGGTIHLMLREEKGDALITVRDEGPGIPPAERTRIFEPFYRIGSELRRETPGIGIGLAIVRDAALAHGGEVHINGSPGNGAEFLLILRGGG